MLAYVASGCWRVIVVALLLLLLQTSASFAHSMDHTLLELEHKPESRQVTATLYCHLAPLLLGLEQRPLRRMELDALLNLEPGRLEKLRRQLTHSLTAEMLVYVEGAEVPIDWLQLPPVDDFISDALARGEGLSAPVHARFTLPEGSRFFSVAPPPQLGMTLVSYSDGSGKQQLQPVIMGTESKLFQLHSERDLDLAGFFSLGLEHVIPKGMDHILFIVTMTLGIMSLRQLVYLVSVFTLTHTIAIAMAVSGMISIPGRIIEPLIALSISLVAMETIFHPKAITWRIKLVAILGLLHGLGFASALGPLQLDNVSSILALVSFNLGVESGQLLVVFAVLTTTFGFKGRYWYRRRVVIPASGLLALAGGIWSMTRLTL